MKSRNKTRFLCIDDDAGLQSLCDALQLHAPIKLQQIPPPETWEKAIDGITERLTGSDFDGLLLDFRLDQHPAAGSDIKARYTAESLVNELRRQSIEDSTDKSYPIILWSTAENLTWYFSINPAYTGLYDQVWEKTEARDKPEMHARRLRSLADGYRILKTAAKKQQAIHEILNCDRSVITTEMGQAFAAKIKQAGSAFNYATFLINRVLHYNGALVDRESTAALLGMMPDVAEPVLKKLSKSNPGLSYDGVFADGFERYWRAPLLRILNTFSPAGHWVHLPAKERVDVLKKKFRLSSIEPAKPIETKYKTDYDCVCAKSKLPLARRDGYRLQPHVLDPWIEPRYVSGYHYRLIPAAERPKWRLDTGEEERFNKDVGT